MTTQQRILWADDEIDLLKPHLLFLRNRGYDVVTANNGRDAFDMAMAEKGYRIVLTTDHGTIRVDNAIKVVGDKNTNTNLRYKLGKNLAYNAKQVYEIKNPARYGLPSPNVSTSYIFAARNDFFAYPNNFNHYVQYYTGTFQHGGISLEEMLVPLASLSPK